MISKLFFVLGYNVSNLFRKKKYKINLCDLISGLFVLLLMIATPILLYVYSDDIANLLIERFGFSEDMIHEIILLFQFIVLFLYTLMFMAIYISKIHFVNKDSISCEYFADSYYYVSNINGKVKKILLRKVEDDNNDLEDEILINLVPFRKVKIGSKILVLYRRYRGINIYVLDGDKKPITLGFSLILLLEVIICITFIILIQIF